MPTTQVEPGSVSFLQEIANSLWKSRKVVVITGAGISTNSGIPDFRSENGLYSLIQAQFDAAAGGEADSSNNGDTDESDLSSETVGERPTKRRRLSRETVELRTQHASHGDSIAVAPPAEVMAGIRCGGGLDASQGLAGTDLPPSGQGDASGLLSSSKTNVTGQAILEAQQDTVMLDRGLEHAPGPGAQPPPGPKTPTRMATGPDGFATLSPLPSPFLPRSRTPGDNGCHDVNLDQSLHFTSSPPSIGNDNSRFPSDSDQAYAHTLTSSPLSSPPPVLYDPYQRSSRGASSAPSSSRDSASSDSESESNGPSSSSTPLLTSQSSFASGSGRNSLPNLKGKDLFDAQIWACPTRTSVFYTFITSLRQKVRDAEPTTSHQFVSILRDSRKLVRCYTQNIDQLEERVGLSTSLELGAGSRYRFSARTARTSGGTRAGLKEQESSSQSPAGLGEESRQLEETNSLSQSQTEPTDSQQACDMVDKKTGILNTHSKAPSSQAKEAENPTSFPSVPATKPPPNRGVECVFLHGSLAELRCFVCGRTSSWDDESRQSDTLAGRQPTCPHCAGATAAREERGKRALGVGKLRPDIVLYGEEHPKAHLISPIVQHDLSLGPDMLLILGTSMRVHGLKVLVREFAKAVHDRGGKVVFVNFTKPPESVWSDIIDYWVQWDCDAWVGDLQKRKPALWLPPGTVLPEEEKPKKLPKASRKSSGGEPSKRKDDPANPKSRRDTNWPVKRPIGRPRKEASSITVSEAKEEAEITALEITAAGSPPAELISEGPSSGANPPAGIVAEVIMKEAFEENQPHPQDASPFIIAPNLPTSTDIDMITPSEEMPSPPKPDILPKKKRVSTREPKIKEAKTKEPKTREPKLNPDAKRPASVRDHKMNGAFLTWKITQDLFKITGHEPNSLPASSPPAPKNKPKAKKTRKSAPAALMTADIPVEFDREMKDEVDNSSVAITESMHESMHELLHIADVPQAVEQESSISALVKTRKRKRQAWKMIRGIETLVDLDSQDANQLETPLVPAVAPVKPRNVARPRPSLPLPIPHEVPPASPGSKPLGELAFQNGFSKTDMLIAKLNNDLEGLRDDDAKNDPSDANVKGFGGFGDFGETDRLIAKYNELATRPATPVLKSQFQLPPLRHENGNTQAAGPPPSQNTVQKLQPLEPKVTSPGPMTEISPNVGSPLLVTSPTRHVTDNNTYMPTHVPRNPFFFADPLSTHFQYPPAWLEHSYEKSHFQVRSPYDGAQSPVPGGFGRHSPPEFGPEDQLRREQEAAMMLSMMGAAGARTEGSTYGNGLGQRQDSDHQLHNRRNY